MGRWFYNKGDIELSKIVTFIIVAVVLIVVVAFFLGGTTAITKTIKGIFFGVTAGTDKTFAIESCKQYCEQARNFDDVRDKQNSAYCTRFVHIDSDLDGEADYTGTGGNKVYTRWYCLDKEKRKQVDGDIPVNSLNVPCDLGKGKDKDNKLVDVTCTTPQV